MTIAADDYTTLLDRPECWLCVWHIPSPSTVLPALVHLTNPSGTPVAAIMVLQHQQLQNRRSDTVMIRCLADPCAQAGPGPHLVSTGIFADLVPVPKG
ncbi:hypothetical protein AB4305_13220 [Nocardia sp. 2YAB30]|uniref:hypothetical protein n=1 Tax=unclassified Nocardia TaxID=2637762 RepID=UPI003F94B9BA